MTAITSAGIYGAGDYYLANDITVAGGTAITFTGPASLNLNGKRLKSTNLGIGIQCSAANNIAITGGNGSWIDGFQFGVASETPWTRIEGVIFDNIKHIAANLTGHTSRFISNTVNGVGGYTTEAYAVGANIGASGCFVQGNLFRNIYRQPGSSGVGEGCAVLINAVAGGALVERNFIANDATDDHTIAIYAGVAGGHVVRHNQVINYETCVEGGGAAPGVTITENLFWRRSPGVVITAISADYGCATKNAIIGYDMPIFGTIPQSDNVVS